MKSEANQNTSRVLMTFSVENQRIVLIFFLKNYILLSTFSHFLLQSMWTVPTGKSHFQQFLKCLSKKFGSDILQSDSG